MIPNDIFYTIKTHLLNQNRRCVNSEGKLCYSFNESLFDDLKDPIGLFFPDIPNDYHYSKEPLKSMLESKFDRDCRKVLINCWFIHNHVGVEYWESALDSLIKNL